MAGGSAVPQIGVRADGLAAFSRDLRKASKALPRQLQKKLKGVAQVVANDAKGRASWSSRIPGSIRTGANARSVYVRAGNARAPHAAPYEAGNAGKRGASTFRHPVFGNREVWVEEATRPFLMPALQANLTGLDNAALAALDEFIAEAGFR